MIPGNTETRPGRWGWGHENGAYNERAANLEIFPACLSVIPQILLL